MTKAYYVKIFSIMDAHKAKTTTDRVCKLNLGSTWDSLSSTSGLQLQSPRPLGSGEGDIQIPSDHMYSSSHCGNNNPTPGPFELRRSPRLRQQLTDHDHEETKGEFVSPSKSPSPVLGKRQRSYTSRGGFWCEEDERLLVKSHTEMCDSEIKYGKWVQLLQVIQPHLREPNRTPTDLKDKYRTLKKTKPKMFEDTLDSDN